MGKNTVRITYTGDDSSLKRTSRDAERQLDRVNSAGKRAFSGLAKSSAVGGAALVAGIGYGLKDSAEAAVEAEKSDARLSAQLQALGKDSDAVRKQIQGVVQAQSEMSGFDDEDLTDAFTNIVRVTGDVEKSLELNNTAMDLARAKQLDVAKAGEIVGKVAGGNIGILSRYGIVVKDGATAQEALAELQKKFAGQAKEYGEKTAGSLDRTQVAAENLQEEVGGFLAPWIAKLATFVADLIPKIEEWARAMRERLRPHIAEVVDFIRENWPTVQRLFGAVVDFVQEHVIPAFGRLAAFVADVVRRIVAVLHEHEPELRRIFDNIKELITTSFAVFEKIVLPLLRTFFQDMLPPLIGVGIRAIEKVSDAFVAVQRVVLRVIDFILTAIDKFLGGLQALFDAASHIPGVGDKFKGIADKIGGARKKVRELRDELDALNGTKVQADVEVRFTAGGRPFRGDGLVGQVRSFAQQNVPTTGALHGRGGRADVVPALWDELGIASMFGLAITSTYRAGAITSTGNVSLHSTYPAQAFDAASGSSAGYDDPAMRAYFNAVIGRPGLDEVILSPYWWHPGSGISRISSPSVLADHYDHVHTGDRVGDGSVGAVGGSDAAARTLARLLPARSFGVMRFVGDGAVARASRGFDLGSIEKFHKPQRKSAETLKHYKQRVAEAKHAWRERLADAIRARVDKLIGQADRAEEVRQRQNDLRRRQMERSGGGIGPKELQVLRRDIDAIIAIKQKKIGVYRHGAAEARSHRFPALARELKRSIADVQGEIANLREDKKDLEVTLDPAQLPADIRLALAQAEGTPAKGDDLTALRRAETFLKKQLGRSDLTTEGRISVTEALNSIRSQIASISSQADSSEPDLQAQLEQAQLQAAIARRSEQLSQSFVESLDLGPGVPGGGGGSFAPLTRAVGGGGGQTIIFAPQSLFPPPARWLEQAARSVSQGLAGQTRVPVSSERIGV